MEEDWNWAGEGRVCASRDGLETRPNQAYSPAPFARARTGIHARLGMRRGVDKDGKVILMGVSSDKVIVV